MTIGLCIITKDWTKELDDKVCGLSPYFDRVYVQVNGGGNRPNDGKVQFDEYKWNDNFADARNALHQEIKTDYWVWMDSDDLIEGLDKLTDTLGHMARNGIEVMFAPYHYEIKNGETVILQWRERIIKTSVAGKWMGRVHETFVPDGDVKMAKTTELQWVHDKTAEDYKASKTRNLKILEEEAGKTDPDPRDLHYLALAYLGEERWEDAIKTGLDYIKVGGWDEEIYRTWLLIAKSEMELEQNEKAIAACMAATRLLPEYPEAYYYLEDIYYNIGDYNKSIEWWKVGRVKKLPDTNSAVDPTVYSYRANFVAAMSYSMLGKVKEAHALMSEVRKVAPKSPEVKEFWPDIEFMYEESKQIEALEEFADYFSKHGGDTELLYKSLPPAIQAYPQISMMMKQYTKPRTWPKKSIVFFCGPGLEPWGPDTLDKGMGGSEEAVTYLSRELIKFGWQVTVYNERTKPFEDTPILVNKIINGVKTRYLNVTYLPWQDFNPNDTFDVICAWRNPSFFRRTKVKARKKLVDMHDTPVGHQVIKPEDLSYIDKVMFKSKFQNSWSEVPQDKVAIISNGIVKEQFDV